MISSSSFLIPLREKSSVHPPITSRSPQFDHLHGFFTAGGSKWRPRVNSATQQSRNSRLFSYGLCPSLADHEARDARTSIDCHRNYQRAVALFPYSRVSTTVSRVASQFCRKKQYATTPSPSFPRLSNYLFSHRHLSPSVHTRPHFVSPLPSLSSSPTHTHTHVQTAILRCFHSFTPLYSPLPFLYFSLSPSLFAIRSPASTSLSRPFPFVLEKERNRDAIRNPFDGTKKYEC